MTIKDNAKLPLKVKIGFGAASLANITWIAFVTFGLIFFTDVAGVAPALAGTVFSIRLLWSAIMDPIVGHISDTVCVRGGRRRPFIIGIAAPFAVVSWLLFTDWGFSPNVSFFQKLLGTEERGWSATGALFGLLCVPGFIITWRATKGRELIAQGKVKHEKSTLKDMWKAVLSNRPLKYALGVYGFGIMSISMWTAMTTYYYMMTDEYRLFLIYFLSAAFGIVFIPIINITANRISQKASWVINVGFFGLVNTIGLGWVLQPGEYWITYTLAILSAGGQMVTYQIGWSMIADCVEVDELKTGYRREGMIEKKEPGRIMI